MPGMIRVERMCERDLGAATRVLARSYSEQPYAAAFDSDPDRRLTNYCTGFTPAVTYCFAHGEPYVSFIDERLTGIALWIPPHNGDPLPEEEREFGLDNLVEVFGAAFTHFLPAEETLRNLRRREVGGPHWFLPLVGADPTEPPDEVVCPLLRPVLRKADEWGICCYAQTVLPHLSRCYEHLDFIAVTHAVESRSGVEYWTLLRKPKAA